MSLGEYGCLMIRTHVKCANVLEGSRTRAQIYSFSNMHENLNFIHTKRTHNKWSKSEEEEGRENRKRETIITMHCMLKEMKEMFWFCSLLSVYCAMFGAAFKCIFPSIRMCTSTGYWIDFFFLFHRFESHANANSFIIRYFSGCWRRTSINRNFFRQFKRTISSASTPSGLFVETLFQMAFQ